MKPKQVVKTKVENGRTALNDSGHTEPCEAFIGHPDDPCDRCGFSYYRH